MQTGEERARRGHGSEQADDQHAACVCAQLKPAALYAAKSSVVSTRAAAPLSSGLRSRNCGVYHAHGDEGGRRGVGSILRAEAAYLLELIGLPQGDEERAGDTSTCQGARI